MIMEKKMSFEDWVTEIETNYPPINYEHIRHTAKLDGVSPRIVLKEYLKDSFNLTDYMSTKLADYFLSHNR